MGRHFENPLQQKIYDFASDAEVQKEFLAMLKVGHDAGDSPEGIAMKLIYSLLLVFHRMPVKPKGQN